MKAIAEYFRDLAADDRYFGAEPPTPDAEMLARIAEREIARRVDARTDGTDIVLRASQALPDAGRVSDPPAEAPADPVSAQTDAAREDAAANPEADVAEATPGSETEAEASPLLAVSEPVASAPADASADEDIDDGFYADASADDYEDEDDYEETYSEAASAQDAELDDDDIFLSDADAPAEPEAPVAMPPAATRPAPRQVYVEHAPKPAPVAAPKVEVPAHPDADSVAAKLQRIRAVVSKQASAPSVSDLAAEDDMPAMPSVANRAAIAALTRGMADAPAQDAAASDESTQDAAEDQAAEAVSDEAATTDAQTTDAQASDAQASDAETKAAPVRARVIKMRRADFDRAVARGQLDAEVEAPAADDAAAGADADDSAALPLSNSPVFDAEDPAIDAYAADEVDLSAQDEDEDEADALSDDTAQDDVDALTDDEFAAEVASDEAPLDEVSAEDTPFGPEDEIASEEDLADLETLDAPMADEAADEASDLSAEDEAELMAELAAVEREMGLAKEAVQPEEIAENYGAADADEADADEAADTAADHDAETAEVSTDAEAEAADEPVAMAETSEQAPRRVRRVQMLSGPDEDEAAVSRIMSKADAQLNEPDSNRRREAIAQLKAAVAAKEAARSLGETDEDDGEVENAFRKDLRDVVRPSRPQAAPARTERPRAAPLKLVAAQRVDMPAAEAAPKAPVAPVRPRRVAIEPAAPAAATAEAAAKAGSFADFAEEMGAHSLGDLLEAAAAYTAFVEGSEDFSRPQLINKVRETSDEFSREDGLRSFGTLLREGRIQKVRNGRFQISDETRFHPERRAG
nr:hypothetical protein [Flavimaricola marinus]